jgi:restriction system protein
MFDELYELLSAAPVWLGPVVAIVAFATFRWAIPLALSAISSENETGRSLSQVWGGLATTLSPFVGCVVILIWVAAEVRKGLNRRRLDRQTGIDSINQLPWQEFESLLCEAFRRQGFVVEHSGGPTPDGGVDIRLSKVGAVTLVQCKHWQRRQVGVTTVRELLGVVSSEHAQSGIVVTSGSFTHDARAFAERNPIRLMDGRELSQMIQGVRTGGAVAVDHATSRDILSGSLTRVAPVSCPNCGAAMTIRTAKSGKHAGSQFYGCTRYPSCRGIRNMTAGAGISDSR